MSQSPQSYTTTHRTTDFPLPTVIKTACVTKLTVSPTVPRLKEICPCGAKMWKKNFKSHISLTICCCWNYIIWSDRKHKSHTKPSLPQDCRFRHSWICSSFETWKSKIIKKKLSMLVCILEKKYDVNVWQTESSSTKGFITVNYKHLV